MHPDTTKQPATDPYDPMSDSASRGSAFAEAFDGDETDGMAPYVRLVPDATDPDVPHATLPGAQAGAASMSGGVPVARMFDPEDIERREYRLLARALTNEDPDTDHLAAMALVQLVKFLRAAGVSVPNFPPTGDIPDPNR